LAQHVTEKRYREIFLLTVGMLPEADDLLLLMKQQIDACLADDPDLQALMDWVVQKAESVEATYKPAAVRAFYLTLDRYLALDRYLVHDLDFSTSLDNVLDSVLDSVLDFSLDRYLAFDGSTSPSPATPSLGDKAGQFLSCSTLTSPSTATPSLPLTSTPLRH
jgi:hypothetical protein